MTTTRGGQQTRVSLKFPGHHSSTHHAATHCTASRTTALLVMQLCLLLLQHAGANEHALSTHL